MKLIQALFQSLRRKVRLLIRPTIVFIVISRRAPIRQRLPMFRSVRIDATQAARYGQLSLL
jgi:hypothetical protein